MIRAAACAGALCALVASLPTASLAAPPRRELGTGLISAVVRDASGHPVSGVLVVAQGPATRSATTTRAGIVTLLGLPVGAYDVRVSAPGYIFMSRYMEVSSDPRLDILNLSVTKTSLGQSLGVASAVQSISLGSEVQAQVSTVIATTHGASIMPAPGVGGGAAPTLLGTSAYETRVELDGIPVAGGPASFAALRFRNALSLDAIDVAEGPAVTTPTVQDAIGGIIDYRTPDFGSVASGSGDFGYSSTFGAFQNFGASKTFGPLSVVADAVTGGGEDRSQTLKARYTFSSSTSVDAATYGSQSQTSSGGVDETAVAPAYSAALHSTLGTAAISLRAFGSSLASTTSDVAALVFASENDVARGVQGRIDVPIGEQLLAFSFDRRSDLASFDDNGTTATFDRTYTSVTGGDTFQLSKAARLEIGDDYSGGTSLHERNDPHVGVSVRPNDQVTIDASAGSSYAVAPDTLEFAQANGAGALQPETAFGYRLSLRDDFAPGDTLSGSIFALRRFDRFATYADARALGLEAGISHDPITSGFVANAYLTLERASAYGPVQSTPRIVDVLDGASLDQLANDPYYTVNSSLGYRAQRGISFGFDGTLVGANSALSPHALGFVDAKAIVPLGNVLQIRVGENNLFAAHVADPLLVPYYLPREFTIIVHLGTQRASKQ